MNKHITTLVILSIVFVLNGLWAQPSSGTISRFPMKRGDAPLFGKDIVINEQLAQNQRLVDVCAAFNGWLFAACTYYKDGQGYLAVTRSIDNGISWTLVYDGWITSYWKITKLEIIAGGYNSSNLKIFVGFVTYDTINKFGAASIYRFNGDPFTPEVEVLQEHSSYIRDMAMISDDLFPASNSNPFSLAVVFSISDLHPYTGDTIIFKTSSNGGMSFDLRKVISITPYFADKVSIGYGRSPTWNTGTFYAAWEVQQTVNSNLGHIYTAHSVTNLNNSFSSPICLDSVYPALINKVRKPVIACQANNYNNDSSDFTEVILFEKYTEGTSNYCVKGFYNLKAASSNYFRPLTITDSLKNSLQPDICFSSYDSSFMVTYFDSTEKSLPLLRQGLNFSNPNDWEIVSPGYNDSSNVLSPYPRVNVNQTLHSSINSWISDGPNGRGIALFDAQYSTYTGLGGVKEDKELTSIKVFPNPCSNTVRFEFSLESEAEVNIQIFDLLGKLCKSVDDLNLSGGHCSVLINLYDLQNGSYTFRIQGNEEEYCGKLVIIH